MSFHGLCEWCLRPIPGDQARYFCSRQCRGLAESGERDRQWKGGRYPRLDGYVIRRIDVGRVELEHRVVAAQMLGRPLASDEIVHHRNRNKSDNRPENLEIMTRREHIAAHRAELIARRRETLAKEHIE